jgi:chemotaxis protein CheX
MDVNIINSFIDATMNVMPQLGFQKVERGSIELKSGNIACAGIMALVGIVGAVKGNIIYNIETEVAKKIASTMMMGAPVNELDAMAQSAISELANMLCANASIKLEKKGISADIAPPILMHGKDVFLKVAVDKVVTVNMLVDGLHIGIDIALE